MMMIAFANTKGGVGKSTLAAHLALWAQDLGIKTALLDTDLQRSSSQWLLEAEPQVTVRTASTPEECLSEVTGLRKSHDLLVADAAGGLADISRTLLILSDLAIVPLTPSILDLRSAQQAVSILKFAQGINGGRPEGIIVLNRMKSIDSISRELAEAASTLGVRVARTVIRDLQAYRDAAGQATSVARLGRKGLAAAADVDSLFSELLDIEALQLNPKMTKKEVANG